MANWRNVKLKLYIMCMLRASPIEDVYSVISFHFRVTAARLPPARSPPVRLPPPTAAMAEADDPAAFSDSVAGALTRLAAVAASTPTFPNLASAAMPASQICPTPTGRHQARGA